MRVFVPFTQLRSETWAALEGATFIPILDKEFGYGTYFRERWAEGESFINVEHDVVPKLETLRSMWNCSEELCVTGYVYEGIQQKPEVTYLGCVKIGKEFIYKHPNLFDCSLRYNECDTQIWTSAEQKYHYHGEVLHLK